MSDEQQNKFECALGYHDFSIMFYFKNRLPLDDFKQNIADQLWVCRHCLYIVRPLSSLYWRTKERLTLTSDVIQNAYNTDLCIRVILLSVSYHKGNQPLPPYLTIRARFEWDFDPEEKIIYVSDVSGCSLTTLKRKCKKQFKKKKR